MLNSILGTELTLTSFLICTGVSLLLGVGTALVAGYRSRRAQRLAVTLAILPAVVQAVIMLVAHFYESRDGTTGGFYADNVQAGQQAWETVNLLLRLDRNWQV